MSHTIKVTGLLEIEDDEFDPGDPTGLTAEAFETYSEQLGLLDMTFRPAP